jgi:hypothetical protein
MIRRPNFLILGAGKCGTTSLYKYLGQHPDVLFSEPREPTFFDMEYEKGLEFYWNKYFVNWNGEKTVGEARPINLLLPFVAARIGESVPAARLICILRNPVDRAYSHWWMDRCHADEKLPFTEAIRANFENIHAGEYFAGEEGARRWKSVVSPVDLKTRSIRIYLECGYYAQQIKNYLVYFPASQIKLVLFEDLCRDTETVVRELWAFLGVGSSVPLGDLMPKNVGVTPLMLPIVKLARRLGINEMVPSRISSQVHYLTSVIGPKPKIAPATRRWLVDHYRPHVREFEELLGRDLSHWLE